MYKFDNIESGLANLTGSFKNFFIKRWKIITVFFIFELVFSAVTAPLFIFFGPFENLKSIAVGSLYTTYSHKYMVDTFLSQEAIERIIGLAGYYTPGETVPVEENSGTADIAEEVNIKTVRTNKIDEYKISGEGLKGNMLIIHDPTKVKVGYSSKLPIEGEYTSTIAKNNKAIAAINAGGFSYDEAWSSVGGKFEGYIIHDGKVIGNVHEDKDVQDDAIGFTEKGELIFGKYSVNELFKMGVKEAITFHGPQLIVKGKKIFSVGETGGYGIAPRTAIGQKATGEIIFLTMDGRSITTMGANMYELQEILYAHGAVNAIALDGGSSSTMYFKNKVINKPSNPMGERAIPSVFMMLPEDGGNE